MSFQVCSSHIFKLIMATIGMKYSLYNFNSCGDALMINWLLSEENHQVLPNS